jgi:hypothetical protein
MRAAAQDVEVLTHRIFSFQNFTIISGLDRTKILPQEILPAPSRLAATLGFLIVFA